MTENEAYDKLQKQLVGEAKRLNSSTHQNHDRFGSAVKRKLIFEWNQA